MDQIAKKIKLTGKRNSCLSSWLFLCSKLLTAVGFGFYGLTLAWIET
jgi:hypothetical protein